MIESKDVGKVFHDEDEENQRWRWEGGGNCARQVPERELQRRAKTASV